MCQRLHPLLLPLATAMKGGDSNDIENRLQSDSEPRFTIERLRLEPDRFFLMWYSLIVEGLVPESYSLICNEAPAQRLPPSFQTCSSPYTMQIMLYMAINYHYIRKGLASSKWYHRAPCNGQYCLVRTELDAACLCILHQAAAAVTVTIRSYVTICVPVNSMRLLYPWLQPRVLYISHDVSGLPYHWTSYLMLVVEHTPFKVRFHRPSLGVKGRASGHDLLIQPIYRCCRYMAKRQHKVILSKCALPPVYGVHFCGIISVFIVGLPVLFMCL